MRRMELRLEAINLSLDRRTENSAEFALIERCRRHDLEAFGALVDDYQGRVYGFVRRMVGATEDSSDVTQEVFVRAFQNFQSFDGRSSVKTWLFRIAYNLCIDRARRARRGLVEVGMHASADSDDWMEVADTRWQPDRVAMQDELATVVERAISTMSEKLRSVLLLHDREDASYEEIAETLGLPVGTVKSRLFLARAHLQNCLRPYLQEDSIT